MNSLEHIHWLDWAIGGLVAAGLIIGACQGLVHMLVRLAIYVSSLYAAFLWQEPVAGFLARKLPPEAPPQLAPVLAHAGIFFGAILALSLMVHLMRKGSMALAASTLGDAKALTPGLGLQALNRLAGAGVGAVVAGLLAGILTWGLTFVNDAEFQASLQGSRLRPVVLREMETVLAAVPEHYKEEFRQALQRFHQAGVTTAGQLGGQGAHLLAELMNQVANQNR